MFSLATFQVDDCQVGLKCRRESGSDAAEHRMLRNTGRCGTPDAAEHSEGAEGCGAVRYSGLCAFCRPGPKTSTGTNLTHSQRLFHPKIASGLLNLTESGRSSLSRAFDRRPIGVRP